MDIFYRLRILQVNLVLGKYQNHLCLKAKVSIQMIISEKIYLLEEQKSKMMNLQLGNDEFISKTFSKLENKRYYFLRNY